MSDYKFNGVELTLEPSEHRWIPQEVIGYDGNGHPIYPATHQFEMSWGVMPVEDAKQLWNFFDSIGSTGTVVVEIPKYKASMYQFQAYSGCVLHELEMGSYFSGNHTNVTLLISNIRV